MRLCCLFVVLLLTVSCQQSDPTSDRLPPDPGDTEITAGMEEGTDKDNARKQWIETMHRTAPGTDWRSIEYRNRMRKHKRKSKWRTIRPRNGEEVIANGAVTGFWYERGSTNQAGRVYATEYVPNTDQIYLIASGGSLLRGPRDGSNWQVINQDFQFEERFLQFIPRDSSDRLLAMIDKVVHYSDDKGLSWQRSEGLDTYDNNWGRRKDAHVLFTEDGNSRIALLVQEWDPDAWESRVSLFVSNDRAESFTRLKTFEQGSIQDFSMCQPGNTQQLYLMKDGEPYTTFFSVYPGDTSLQQIALSEGTDDFEGQLDVGYLTGVKRDAQLVFFTYNSDHKILKSTDTLKTLTVSGYVPEDPWAVGLYCIPSNPEVMLFGEVECYKSTDDGASWTKLNRWSEYYDNVVTKLHADMRYYNEFQTINGTDFLLISNDGGLSISYNDAETTENIGLQGMNVSQYYSVRTHPNQEEYLYAGSQDQGFQVAHSTSHEPVPFDQKFSGDFGHIVFSEFAQRLWTMYPGGLVIYSHGPTQGAFYTASWELESNDESVWIPPMMSHPDPSKNAVYMAGGNIDGGDGSHLIELSASGGNHINKDQLEFDFKAASGGEISAMAHSPLNPDNLYVATTNGSFFYSKNRGQTWTQSSFTIPEAQYLYGTAIHPSPVDEKTVYVGGSGYDNPPVFRSINGGLSFSPLDRGLPPTLVYDITGDPQGDYLFAGTETGPYIHIISVGQWYDMSGLSAPLQKYWSVEYLPELNTVRFGTYGRGVWDFVIEEGVDADAPTKEEEYVNIYPNPATDLFKIDSERGDLQFPLKLYNQSGQLQRVWHRQQATYDVSDVPPGHYYLHWTNGHQEHSFKLFIQ